MKRKEWIDGKDVKPKKIKELVITDDQKDLLKAYKKIEEELVKEIGIPRDYVSTTSWTGGGMTATFNDFAIKA